MGTPGWLSPEQYEGRDVTSASDVFAWASPVVFAATGAGPFGQATEESVAYRTVHAAHWQA
ncbi:protein kinase family protein [Actinomadura algeriensis]|uniref:Serine/threonine protein kinase n=1 Tax=Actinomadura algeriensis TaxID=1679523 RepID=A0ABR9JPW5_9ACTN|nr:hypothetical protein [Actinomadura algeriensis]MBE1532596.1 serine/threonine protein kinase [Actinomadura algeriensis]